MSDYGADKKPSIPAAQDLAYTKGFMPLDKTNVMQWTYPDDVIVRKLANKTGKSNCLFKFAPPPPDPVIPPDLPPVPAGDACAICWGDGKPFGVGETPESVTVVVQDIEKGPSWFLGLGEPPNGTFVFAQVGGTPCRYEFANASFFMVLVLAPAPGEVGIIDANFFIPSFVGRAAECQTFYENNETTFFIGGTATVFFPPIS